MRCAFAVTEPESAVREAIADPAIRPGVKTNERTRE